MDKIEECKNVTQEHIDLVQKKIDKFRKALKYRKYRHDLSKLSSDELPYFTEMGELKNITYGSEEYFRRLNELKPALDHHYKENRHHPEHFENQISGMNLVDLVEMLCDWVASVKRHDDGNIYRSIEINSERFKISDQLKQILINTIDEHILD